MLVRTLIASAVVAGFMMTGVVATTALAQGQPMKKSMSMKKGSAMHSEMHKGMAKEGHKMDNIADKLNACQSKPAGDRQSCMDAATK